jgi:hypothetical protein
MKLTVVISLATALLLVIIVLILRLHYRRQRSKLEDYQLIYLIPNKRLELDFTVASKIINQLHSTSSQQNLLEKILKIPTDISLYIDGDYSSGIKLLISLPSRLTKTVIESISLYSDQIDYHIEQAKNSLLHNKIANESLTTNFHLKKHYSYPLFTVADQDSLATIISSISFLEPNESAVIRIHLTATNPTSSIHLKNRILNGIQPKLFNSSFLGQTGRTLWALITFVVKVLDVLLRLIEEIYSPYKIISKPKKSNGSILINNPLNTAQLDKLYQPLFKTNLQTIIVANSSDRLSMMDRQFKRAITDNLKSKYQSLVTSKKTNHRPINSEYSYRLKNDLWSVSELASIFRVSKESSIAHLYATSDVLQLPPRKEDRQEITKSSPTLIGYNKYRGKQSCLYLSDFSRTKHLYISGTTGSGKSSMLASIIEQDIKAGKGISLIDPHGDLALRVLDNIPSTRLKDVIYFDPTDLNHPIGLNLMEISSKKGSLNYKLEAERITEGLISLFRKLFYEDDGPNGHRIEYIIRNSVHTALTIDNCTIFTIYRLLTDNVFRQKVVARLSDKSLVNFWRNELGKAGDFAQVKMSSGVTTKIGRYLFSEPAKRTFGQAYSTINFNDIIKNKKILICNFSKGQLGEDGCNLFGISVLTKLQLAILTSSKIEQNKRQEHYLFVDEFQNFATKPFAHMLAESRKYKLSLTIAEQSLSQQDESLANELMANIANIISFRTASPNDETRLLKYFSEYLTTNSLQDLPYFHFYLRSASVYGSSVTSGYTVMSKPTINNQNRNKLINKSRKRYAYRPVTRVA